MASFLHATAKRLKLPAFEEHYAKETAIEKWTAMIFWMEKKMMVSLDSTSFNQ
jgi:hypothetical protein